MGNSKDILDHHLSTGYPNWFGTGWFDLYCISDIDRNRNSFICYFKGLEIENKVKVEKERYFFYNGCNVISNWFQDKKIGETYDEKSYCINLMRNYNME